MADHLPLIMHSIIKSNDSSPAKSTATSVANIKQEEIDTPLHTLPEATFIMRAGQHEGFRCQIFEEAVEFEFSIQTNGPPKIDIKKEKEEMKAAAAHQKRLTEKYAKIDDTPIYILEEIEYLQEQYARAGSEFALEVIEECRSKLRLSDDSPWLVLTRKSFPRRKKGAKEAVKEYIFVPLIQDAPFSEWTPHKDGAMPHIASFGKTTFTYPISDSSEEEGFRDVKLEVGVPIESKPCDVLDNEDDMHEIFAAELAAEDLAKALATPSLSSNADSSSELSSIRTPSMDSEGFEQSHSSGTYTQSEPTPSQDAEPMASQQYGVNRSRPGMIHGMGTGYPFGESPNGGLAGYISDSSSNQPESSSESTPRRRSPTPSFNGSGPSSSKPAKRRRIQY